MIWRDLKLKGGDVFGEEIVSQFPKTALLVSILFATLSELGMVS